MSHTKLLKISVAHIQKVTKNRRYKNSVLDVDVCGVWKKASYDKRCVHSFYLTYRLCMIEPFEIARTQADRRKQLTTV
jgi:hypothetical protein